MKFLLIALLYLPWLADISAQDVSRYVYKNLEVNFRGEHKLMTYESSLVIEDDIDMERYRYHVVAVPFKGKIEGAKIVVTDKDGNSRKLKKNDAILVTYNPDYVLVSDNELYSWDLGKLNPGDRIDHYVKTKEVYASAGDFYPILDDIPVDTARVCVKFPSKKWRLKYSVDNNDPQYYDVRNDTTFVWYDQPPMAESRFENAPFDFRPGLMYLFESKIGEDDYSSWDDIYRWANDRIESVATIKNPDKMLGMAANPGGILAAIKSQCRYVAVEIGEGGYTPTAPDNVWENGYGDCKGLATLFVSWMKSAGYDSWPVLVLADRERLGNELFPTPFQFNHMIAAYVTLDGDTVYQDLTAEYCPLGYLPTNLFGSFALPLLPDPSCIRLGYAPLNPDSVIYKVSGDLFPGGIFGGMVETRLTGHRALYAGWQDKSTRQGNTDNYIKSYFEREIPRANVRNPELILLESDNFWFGGEIFIRNFGYIRDSVLILRPWIFDFLDINTKLDSQRTWPTILRRNVVYKIEYRAGIPDATFMPTDNSDQEFEGENISYAVDNNSHDDSLIVDLTLTKPPRILDPDSYNQYKMEIKQLSEALNNRIMFVAH
jgi:hypothetical protein